LLAGPILTLIYKQSVYLQATTSFQIFLLLPVILFLNLVISNAIVAAGWQKHNTIATVIGATISIILNLALIPRYRINGAAMATVAAELAVMLYLYPAYRHKIDFNILGSYFAAPILASVVMAGVILSLRQDLATLPMLIISALT